MYCVVAAFGNLEEQVDKYALDPTKIADACERPKMKN
jgi:hypothetical protein